MKSLPPGLAAYSRTATFTEATIPAGLRRAHSTKDGAWAEIHVFAGELVYRVIDPRRAAYETVLSPDVPAGVIEPTILHEVQPRGPVQFYVEFFRATGVG